MFDVIIELAFMFIFEGLVMSSARDTPKKIKICHAIFRTIFYLCMLGIFVFLGIVVTGFGKWLCLILSLMAFVAMIRTNWISYKRQEEWEIIQNNAVAQTIDHTKNQVG